jgi:hypothetical protein
LGCQNEKGEKGQKRHFSFFNSFSFLLSWCVHSSFPSSFSSLFLVSSATGGFCNWSHGGSSWRMYFFHIFPIYNLNFPQISVAFCCLLAVSLLAVLWPLSWTKRQRMSQQLFVNLLYKNKRN